MIDIALETDTFAAGTAGSLWSAAEVLILLFGPVGIWLTTFFPLFLPSYSFTSRVRFYCTLPPTLMFLIVSLGISLCL